MTSLYNQEIFINDPSIINNELAFGIFNLLNILNIVNHLEYLDDNIGLFKQIINKNLNIMKKNIIDNDIVVINNIINADFGDSDDESESYFSDFSDFGGIDDPNKYDNLSNYNKDKYYPNKYFCLIILLFIRKISVESDEKWYKKIIKMNQDADLDFENIKISLKTLLKTYVIHLLITTYSLTNVRELFDEYIKDINLVEFPLKLKGGSETILKQDEDIILNQDGDITNKQSKFTYELQKLTEIELINKKLEDNLLKFDIINNKLNNNLKKLFEINDYFEDVNHPYLLNYNMEPEIIRKIKDENNIEEVFNILKDILELK